MITIEYDLVAAPDPEAPCVATQPHHPTSTYGSSDISIRDHFAAAALQGLMAYYGGFCDQDAKAAYAAADAMLKARGGDEVSDNLPIENNTKHNTL